MDKQSRGLGPLSTVRGVFTMVWAVLSTVFFSIPCAVLGSRKKNRVTEFLARFWARQLMAAAGVKIRVRGNELIPATGKYVLVSNHQSHFDIPALMAVLPHRLRFAAKKELFRIPFFGWGITAVGHIRIDRSSARKARESLTQAVRRLQTEDICTVIFPEGTRSPDGRLGEFKRGSFTMAVESGLPVLPAYIDGTIRVLPKKSLLARAGVVTITFGHPISTTDMDKEELSTKARKSIEQLSGVTE